MQAETAKRAHAHEHVHEHGHSHDHGDHVHEVGGVATRRYFIACNMLFVRPSGQQRDRVVASFSDWQAVGARPSVHSLIHLSGSVNCNAARLVPLQARSEVEAAAVTKEGDDSERSALVLALLKVLIGQ